MNTKKTKLWESCLAATLSLGFCAAGHAGVWMNINEDVNNGGISISQVQDGVDFLDAQNDANSSIDPWVGLRIDLTWADIPSSWVGGVLQYDFSHLEDLLDEAYYRSVGERQYKVVLTINDKYWNFADKDSSGNVILDSNGNPVYTYVGGALDSYRTGVLGAGLWGVTQNGVDCVGLIGSSAKEILVERISSGAPSCVTNSSNGIRFSVAGSNTNTVPARKYSAVRWNSTVGGTLVSGGTEIDANSPGRWFTFWSQLAAALKDHPALYAIVTPESSIAGITYDNDELSYINYPGADEYYRWQIAQAKKIGELMDGVPVISSVNWISEITGDSHTAPHYQEEIGTALGGETQTIAGIDYYHLGWWAQDLRKDGNFNDRNSYVKSVYPQFEEIADKSMTFTMITGDTYNNSTFVDPLDYANELLELADDIGAGHLVFLQEKQKVNGVDQNEEIFTIIEGAGSSAYSFLGSDLEITSEWVNGQGQIVLNANNGSNLTSYSADGFSVMVKGVSDNDYQESQISSVAKHSTKQNRLVVTLTNAINTTDNVIVKYNSRAVNAVMDDVNNRLGAYEEQVQEGH